MKITYTSGWGVQRTMVADEATPNSFGIFSEQDMEEVIRRNQALSEHLDRKSPNRLVARVPIIIYERALREGWGDDDWKRWLNDPENRDFRVWPGQV